MDLPEDDRTFTVEEVPESFLLVQVDAGIERFQGNYDIDDIATQFGNASAGLSDYKMLDLDISTFKTDANILADTYAWYRELTDTLPEGKETVTNHATTTAETN